MMKRKYFSLMELALVLSVLMLGMVMTVSAVPAGNLLRPSLLAQPT